MRGFKWKCLPQLLDDPSARRMLRDVEVQDASTIVADDEETIEHAERDRWHREEIHGRNRFPMVSKEGQPALAWSGPLGARFIQREMVLSERSKPSMRSSHGSAVLPRLGSHDHLKDQLANLLRRLFPSNLPPDWKLASSTYENLPGASGRQFQV